MPMNLEEESYEVKCNGQYRVDLILLLFLLVISVAAQSSSMEQCCAPPRCTSTIPPFPPWYGNCSGFRSSYMLIVLFTGCSSFRSLDPFVWYALMRPVLAGALEAM